MARRSVKVIFPCLALGILGGVLALAIPNLVAMLSIRSRVSSVEAAPHTHVAIVFGAGLQRNGSPSAILRDRVETAVELYKAGKVDKLLMSGDNRFLDYNEPGSMRDYAISLGVPETDIVLDYAGRRTYDTCYRARHIFNVDQAVLITQGFHLTRALFTCNNLGVSSIGIPAEVRQYRRRSYAFWYFREIPATSVAMWEIFVTRPLPVLGKPEPIASISLP